MPCLPCGGKVVIAAILSRVQPRLFRFFWNCHGFDLSRPTTVYRENGMSGPANVIQCLPVGANASNRCVLNIQVFASCYEASLNETISIFCADLMDTSNRVYVTKQLYSRISNARSKPSMIKDPMFLSGVRTYGT
jgi:hypothetical protein